MQCPSCGRENRTDAEYCAWCGTCLTPEQTPDSKDTLLAEPSASDVPRDASAAPAMATAPADIDLESTAPSPTPPSSEPEDDALPTESVPDASVAELDEPTQAHGPLQPGDILAERYRIIEQIECSPERNKYRAVDMARCALCGYDQNAIGTTYCAECGASLDLPCYVTLLEHVQETPEQYDLQFQEGNRDYFVTIEPVAEAAAQKSPTSLRLRWGCATDTGLQRDHNEDCIDARLYTRGNGETVGLFVVADGLGGQDSGEVASQMTTDAIWESLRESVWEPLLEGQILERDDLERQLVAAVQAANQQVYDARTAQSSEMSTTLTLALIVNEMAYIGNVGDSRAYLWNADGLRALTRDHSLVQRLIDSGDLSPEERYTHPQRHVIYQSIGDLPEVTVGTFQHTLTPDDCLILCSDGLWEMVRDEGIEDVLLAEPDPSRAAKQLVHNANLAGGEDNISVIIVQAKS